MYTRKRRGPSTEPCSIPAVTGAGCEEAFSTFTVKIRPVRKIHRISSMGPITP